jgi:putative membrane protein
MLRSIAAASSRAAGGEGWRAAGAMLSSRPTVLEAGSMLSAIIGYATHVIASALLLGVFFYLYTWLTPFDEVALIHAGKTSAALSLGGALIGFSLTLGSAIVHNATLMEVVVWAVLAMVVQVIVYVVTSRMLHTVVAEISAGNTAMGGFMGSLSLVAGVVNAACLS